MANVSVTTVSPAGTYSVNPESLDYLVQETAGASPVEIHLREQERVLYHAGPIATTAALFTNTGPTFVTLVAAGGKAARVVPAAVDSVVATSSTTCRILFSSGATLDIAGTYADTNTALAAGRSYSDMSNVGPFSETTAASQSGNQLNFPVAAVSYVAPKRGCVLGVTAALSEAITGVGTQITAEVFIEGVVVPASATLLTFTQAGAEVTRSLHLAPGAVTFAAGARIDVRYTSTGISNTPVLVENVLVAFDTTDTTVP